MGMIWRSSLRRRCEVEMLSGLVVEEGERWSSSPLEVVMVVIGPLASVMAGAVSVSDMAKIVVFNETRMRKVQKKLEIKKALKNTHARDVLRFTSAEDVSSW